LAPAQAVDPHLRIYLPNYPLLRHGFSYNLLFFVNKSRDSAMLVGTIAEALAVAPICCDRQRRIQFRNRAAAAVVVGIGG
jgi:hypothetical protein